MVIHISKDKSACDDEMVRACFMKRF